MLDAVCVLGAFTFASAGLLVASRPRTVKGGSGMMNVVMMPMWILQPIVQALPLTALNDALRRVMRRLFRWQ